ncbi:hypothetical protein KKD57_00570 [Patescibacteria group bacterium]|nr:hypothetical protein [Patescibacteria group bacterium]
MSIKFQECIKKGKIKIFSRGKDLADKELRMAQEDLDISQSSFGEKNLRYPEYKMQFYKQCNREYTKNYIDKITKIYQKLCQS